MSRPSWMHVFLDVPQESWEESVAFWPRATGTDPSAPWGEHDQFRTLRPPEGDAWLDLQAVDGEPGVHIDLFARDREAAADASLAAGAEHVWTREGVPVVRSPGGLFLCHIRGAGGPMVRADPERLLDQVCIDIPADRWDEEVTFWERVLGRDAEPSGGAEFLRIDVDGLVRVLLQRLGEADGPVRAHADFATGGREEETRRHEGLGARVVEVFEPWTVMRAPDGHLYCLTDRDPLTGARRR